MSALLEKPEDGFMRAYIGLGGNIGDVYSNFFKALELLDDKPGVKVLKISSVYKTPPWGITNQDWFVNTCAVLDFSISPVSLLEDCLDVEDRLNRARTVRWGPRTMDLDILFIEDFEIKTENLIVPHPRTHLRSFVIKPLYDLNDQLIVQNKTIAQWLESFDKAELDQIVPVAMDETPQLGKAEWRI
jgi:2-amino-4-hydroxy-6-hydroxymethyldihydropteridine diphosphokinase